jgi:rRNA maturation RNase YbeY
MITIRNRQRKIPINMTQLKKDTQTILDALDYADYDIGIVLTTNKMMQDYNREYREKDKPTDVLSFPYHTELKAGERIKPLTDDDKNLGDLIFAPEYINDDLKNHNVTFEERLKLLLVHGICHLLGYDHISDEDYKVMHKKEKELLKKLE